MGSASGTGQGEKADAVDENGAGLIDRFSRPLSGLAIAPFAIPLLVMMPIFLKNRLWIPLEDFLPTLLTLLAITLAVVTLFQFFARDWRKSSILATLTVAFLLYTPSLADAFSQDPMIRMAIIGIVGLMLLAIARRIPSESGALNKANGQLNLILLAFAVPSIGMAIYQGTTLELGRPDPRGMFAPFSGKADDSSPDVWHIVMDRYPNSETLRRVYEFDNSEFLDALRTRGFAVNETAHSNYQVTNQSLASTLNADYLDRVTAKIGNPVDVAPLFVAVRENRAAEFFSKNGYKVIFADTWANITASMARVDQEVGFRSISEVPLIIFNKSLPGEIARHLDLPYADRRRDQCLREKSKFEQLREIAATEDRKLVFAHFLVPHPPFVFRADGSCQTPRELEENTRAENFTLQIRFANRELLDLIDAILAGPRPATILLHSDEGPIPAKFADDEAFRSTPLVSREEWKKAGPDLWKEKMGILMAIRHANGETQVAPETPINLYPLVLNRSFSGQMAIRPERSYFARDPDKKFEYTDVTESLRSDLEATN